MVIKACIYIEDYIDINHDSDISLPDYPFLRLILNSSRIFSRMPALFNFLIF